MGVLGDDSDPMVSVMKLEKAPKESYADIGGLEEQIQEIKESVELPLTHPEYVHLLCLSHTRAALVVLIIATLSIQNLSRVFTLSCVIHPNLSSPHPHPNYACPL